VNGRKIPAPVDTEGLPLRVVVHSAGVQDRDGAALVLSPIRDRFPWLELVRADAGHDARQVKETTAAIAILSMEIVRRSDKAGGFEVQSWRWVVERTFSWFGRNRQLARAWEKLAETLATFVTRAAIRTALKRRARLA